MKRTEENMMISILKKITALLAILIAGDQIFQKKKVVVMGRAAKAFENS